MTTTRENNDDGDARPARKYDAVEVEALIDRSAALLDELHQVTREMADRLHDYIGEAGS